MKINLRQWVKVRLSAAGAAEMRRRGVAVRPGQTISMPLHELFWIFGLMLMPGRQGKALPFRSTDIEVIDA